MSPCLRFISCAPPLIGISFPFLTSPSSPSSFTKAFSSFLIDTSELVPFANALNVPSASACFEDGEAGVVGCPGIFASYSTVPFNTGGVAFVTSAKSGEYFTVLSFSSGWYSSISAESTISFTVSCNSAFCSSSFAFSLFAPIISIWMA